MRRLCFFLLILGVGCLNVHAGKDKSELDKIKLDEKQRLQETEFFMDASRAKMLGDFTQAKTLFEKVLEINPHNAAAHYELAMLYLASNQYEKAENAAFNATDLMPTNKWYRDAYRQALSKGGKFEKAAKLMEKIVKDEPRNIENYFEWAYLLLNAGKYKEGVDVYNQLEKITGISEEISIEKEKILLKINDVKGAAEELKKLINAFPNEIRYQLMLGEVYQVNKFKKEARVVYQNILEKESSNPYALMALANIYKEDGDVANYNKVIKGIIENPKGDIDAKIAYLYTALQKIDKMPKEDKDYFLMLANLLVKTHPKEAKSNALMGDFYFLNDSNANALKYYRKSLAIQSDVYAVWQQFFSILLEEKLYQEINDSANAAIEIYPTQGPTFYFAGLANYYLKNYDVAEKHFKRAVVLSGENQMLKAQIRALLGDLYFEQKRFDESESSYESAIEIDAKNAYAMNNYAYHLSLRGKNLDKALDLSKKSLELQPNSTSFLDTYAWILFKQGKFAEAKDYLQKGLDLEKTDRNTLLEHMGDVLFHLGDKGNAVEYWKKAAEGGVKSEILKKKIEKKSYFEEPL